MSKFEEMYNVLLPYAAILVVANLSIEEIISEFMSVNDEYLTSLLVKLFCNILENDATASYFTFGNDVDVNLNLSAKCAEIFTKALTQNTHIKEVIAINVFNNELHDEVAKVFAEFLKTNKTLEILNIANNEIEHSGALDEASQYNNTLQVLWI